MKKWEYKSILLGTYSSVEDVLKHEGKIGWEAFAFTYHARAGTVAKIYFKREMVE